MVCPDIKNELKISLHLQEYHLNLDDVALGLESCENRDELIYFFVRVGVSVHFIFLSFINLFTILLSNLGSKYCSEEKLITSSLSSNLSKS